MHLYLYYSVLGQGMMDMRTRTSWVAPDTGEYSLHSQLHMGLYLKYKTEIDDFWSLHDIATFDMKNNGDVILEDLFFLKSYVLGNF